METMTMPELRQKGLETLFQTLGAVGFADFLRDMGLSQEDYTAWRQQQPQPETADEAIALMKLHPKGM